MADEKDKPTSLEDIIGSDWNNPEDTDIANEDVQPVDYKNVWVSYTKEQAEWANEMFASGPDMSDVKESNDLSVNMTKLNEIYLDAKEASNGEDRQYIPEFQITKLHDTYRINVSGWSWAFDEKCSALVSTVLMSLTTNDHVVIDYENIGRFPQTEYQIVRGLASQIVACKATVHMDFPFLGSLADLVLAMSADNVNIGDGASLILRRHFNIDNVSDYAQSQHKLIRAVFDEAVKRKIISTEECNHLCTDVDAELLVVGSELRARFKGEFVHPVPTANPEHADTVKESDVPEQTDTPNDDDFDSPQ